MGLVNKYHKEFQRTPISCITRKGCHFDRNYFYTQTQLEIWIGKKKKLEEET